MTAACSCLLVLLVELCGAAAAWQSEPVRLHLHAPYPQRGPGCGQPPEPWEEHSECDSLFLNVPDMDCEPQGSQACEPLLALNTDKILSQAKTLAEQKSFPFATESYSTNEELAIGYVLIGSGLPDEAIRHFSTMLQDDPELSSAIYGRGIAHGKRGLQDTKNAELALLDLSHVLNLQPDHPEVYEQRAEILSPLGRVMEALNDLSKAIELQPSARLYRHRGTLHFVSEDYATAHDDFQHSLELHGNQPIALLYKGLTYFHRGLLQEAIETFKEALRHKSDFIDAYKSLGQAYRELGNFDAATESFQKALMLDPNHVQTLQFRGMMLYHHGSLQESLQNFK